MSTLKEKFNSHPTHTKRLKRLCFLFVSAIDVQLKLKLLVTAIVGSEAHPDSEDNVQSCTSLLSQLDKTLIYFHPQYLPC